ncbi:hypothetical protein ACFWPK_04315 [Nocardia sp. NPDC058519]|uniref:hypothetical protein n=1 Tax=Nocardia sp. NPDC058519 TaxID=3346535 RepID=UPI00364B58CE
MEAFAFPDIEAELVAWLASKLAGLGSEAVVATKVPNPRPVEGVRVARVGGIQVNVITDEPRIVLECYAATAPDAAALARMVRAVLATAAGGVLSTAWCDRVRDLGMAFLPDLEADLPRYLVTAEVRVRGTPL